MRKRLLVLALVLIAVLTTCALVACGEGNTAEHDWEDYKVVSEATCTKGGVVVQRCSFCHIKQEIKTEALGHHLVSEGEDIKATCTKDGREAFSYCDREGCDYEIEGKVIPALGHDLKVVPGSAINPTCEEDGCEATMECVRKGCDHEVEGEVITATGHAYGEWISVGNGTHKKVCANSTDCAVITENCQGGSATCEEKAVCSICNGAYGDLAGHDYESVVTDPTCEDAGYTTYTCGTCGDTYVGDETPALGHDYESVTTPATCLVDGLITYTCKNDSAHNYTEVIPALGHKDEDEDNACDKCGTTMCTTHDWDDGEVTTEPSCEEAGVKTFTCTACGETKTEDIAAIGHTVVTDEAVDATCEETGLTEGSHCSVCNKVLVEQEVIEATGHTEVVDEAVAPTCEDTGLTEGKHCSVCGEVLVAQEEVAATGHTVVTDEAVDATCEETGLTEGSHCSVCGEVFVAQEVVEATGHTEVVDAAVDATCEGTGLTEGKHCSVCNKVFVEQEEIPATGHTEVTDEAVAPTCEETGLTEGSHCSACGEVFVAQEVIDAKGHEYQGAEYRVIEDELKIVHTCHCNHENVEDVDTSVSVPVTNEKDINTVLTAGYDAYLNANITLEEGSIEITSGDVELNLNGYNITATGLKGPSQTGLMVCEVFYVQSGATLTIVGEGTLTADPGEIEVDHCVDVISACDGSIVNLKGGRYISSGCTVVYATRGGIVNISAGYFEALDPSYTLDVDERVSEKGIINVTGGTYVKFNPANHTNDGSDYTNKVADGYHSILDGTDNYVVSDHVLNAVETIAPTCIAQGYTVYACDCRYTENKDFVTDENAHDWNDGEVTTEPTCEEAGVKTYTCEHNAEHTYTEAVDATGHDWNDGEVITEATCTAEGKKLITCQNDTTHTKEETIAKLSHEFENGVCKNCPASKVEKGVVFELGTNDTSKAGDEKNTEVTTSIEAGTIDGYTLTLTNLSKVYECYDANGNYSIKMGSSKAVGSFTFTVPEDVTSVIIYAGRREGNGTSIDVNGSAYTLNQNATAGAYDEIVIDTTNVKTITVTSGKSGDKRCFIGDIEFVVEGVCEHAGTEGVVTDPTCEDAGYTTYTCASCSHSWTVAGDEAIGHAWNEGEVTTAPTCTEKGEKTYTCEHNAEHTKIEEVDATGHTEVVDEAVAPTCEDTGLTEGKHCSVCGEVLVAQEEVAANGHAYGEGVVTTEPNCTEKGVKTFTCATCGNTKTEDVEANGHKDEDENGRCDDCTNSMCAEHDWNEGEVTTEPKCEEDGVKTFTCTACGETKTEPVSANGHTEEVDEAVAPTCEDTGLTEGKHCSVCNKVLVAQEEVAANGHTEEVDEAVAPTCEETGLTEGKHCSVCEEVLVAQEVVSAIGHKWNEGEVTTEATCTEEGKKLLTCQNDTTHTTEESIAKIPHDFEDGVCKNCPAVQEEKTATFTFGANGTATHADGSAATSYSEKANDITLTLSNMSGVYTGARDAKGNSALKLGSGSSNTGSFTFTVPGDVTKVVIYVAKYKANTTNILVNGNSYTISTASNNGEYTAIEVDTSSTKTVSFETVSGGHRCMIDAIKFISIQVCEHTGVTSETIAPTCTEAGYTLYTGTCGHSWTVAGDEATEHKLTAVEGKEATCSETGINAHYNCEKCGKNYTDETATEEIANVVIDKVDHTPAEAVQENVQNATCTEDGSYESVVYCSECNEELSRETKNIDALGHDFVDGVCDREGCGVSQCTEHVREDGTYVHEGEEHYQICDNCSVEFNRGTCSWDEGKVTTEPTCTEKGVKTYTCGTCNGTKTEEIGALGHTEPNAEGKCDTCGTPLTVAKTTVSASIEDLITSEGWTSSTTKQSFSLDSVVSVKVGGGNNSGKAYDGDHIRLYATDSPAGSLTISVADGYELVSVKISCQTGTYAFLYVGEDTTTDISNVETTVSGSSVVLNAVKNGTNGKQVRVTAIEVVYAPVQA